MPPTLAYLPTAQVYRTNQMARRGNAYNFVKYFLLFLSVLICVTFP